MKNATVWNKKYNLPATRDEITTLRLLGQLTIEWCDDNETREVTLSQEATEYELRPSTVSI